MTIQDAPSPANAREIVLAELARLRDDPQLIAADAVPQSLRFDPAQPGSQPGTLEGLPIYWISRANLLLANWMERAVRTGEWVYPVTGGRGNGVARVREQEAAAPAYSSMDDGGDRLVVALQLARQILENSNATFEPRILSVGSTRMAALWMSGIENIFISLFEGDTFDLVADIVPLLTQRVGAPSTPAAFNADDGPSN